MKRFSLLSVAVIGVLIGGVTGYNVVMDPYGSNLWFQIPGVNARKNYSFTEGRFQGVLNLQPESVMFGSSRVGAGFSLLKTDYLRQHQFYKFHYAASNAVTVMKSFRFVTRHAPLKRAIVGLDFFMFNACYEPDGFVQLPVPMAFTLQQTRESLALAAFQKDPEVFEHTVQLRGNFDKMERTYVVDFYYPAPCKNFRFQSADGKVDTLKAFREILEMARSRNVELYLYLSPEHARLIETMDAIGLYPLWEEWKIQLVHAVEENNAANPGQRPYVIWDFSGYNNVTTEGLPEEGHPREMEFYTEDSHFKMRTGDLIIGTIVSGRAARAGFGTPLSGKDIASHLADIRTAQAAYRRAHDSESADVRLTARLIQNKFRYWQVW